MQQRQIVFECPRTGMNVQHWDELSTERSLIGDSYVPVRCPACSSIHFVNSATGKLLGDRSGQGYWAQRST
jgi:predicted RNA-binding Zn-ribbon protein involved in translation (DUF1610 family)